MAVLETNMVSINDISIREKDAEKSTEEIVTNVNETLVPLKKEYHEWKERRKRGKDMYE